MISGLLNEAADRRGTFRALFVAGPFLMCSLVPSMLFGLLYGEWGSNIIWGSVFGLGWCMAAFWSGNLVHDDFSAAAGLLWGWFVLFPLFFGSGWLWRRCSERGRKSALLLLGGSLLPDVPSHTLMAWERHGVHLPDFALHMAASY